MSLLATKYTGGHLQKSYYDGIRDLDPSDHMGNDLNMQLLGVLQSVDTRPYYRRMVDDGTGNMKVHYETEADQKNRLNKQLKSTMSEIDRVLDDMHTYEVSRAKRKAPGLQVPKPVPARKRAGNSSTQTHAVPSTRYGRLASAKAQLD